MENEQNNKDSWQLELTPLVKGGISFNVAVISPSETITSLQIVCFFDFQKNQHYEGGTNAVNEHLGGGLHQIRQTGIFHGRALETLLLTPVLNQIPARQLLLLGLGDPAELSLDLLELAGYTAAMEAIKMGVKDFCFAPSLKDAGIVLSFGKTDISRTVAKGILGALAASAVLLEKDVIEPIALTEVNLLAGAPQARNAYLGLKQAIEN